MSGSVAGRYVTGLPYDPALGIGQYARAPRLPGAAAPTPGTASQIPLGMIDANGQAVRVTPGVTTIGGTASGAATGAGVSGGEGGGLLSALLGGAGLLQYLPDAYDALFGEEASRGVAAPVSAGGALGAGQIPAGQSIPEGAQLLLRGGESVAAPAGAVMTIDGKVILPDGGFYELSPFNDGLGYSDLPTAPTETLDLGGGMNGVGSGANWAGVPNSATTVGIDAGSVGGVDIANGLAYAPAAVFGMGTPAFAKPGGEVGGQIGSTLGGILGGVIGGPWGAAAGTIAGGAIGGQIGPAPTIGRNFSSIGTFDGSGNLQWGNAGGDNGGEAGDATSFADWFGANLSQQAAQQGLAFNPNMTGAQVRVGGYDNFSRVAPTAGGYFYDITNQGGGFGGDPNRYALRPLTGNEGGWNTNSYTPQQANDFSTNVLADLAARNVYTPGGTAQGSQADLGATLGADYGWYGQQGTDWGGGDFNSLLSSRQGAITGYRNAQQEQQQNEALLAQQQQEAAAGNPWGAVGVDPGLIAPGLFGGGYDPGGA